MSRALRALPLLACALCALPLRAQTFDAPTPAARALVGRGDDAGELEPLRGDGRRTLGRFGHNLGRNLVGVVARDNLKPLLVGALATSGGALLDGRTERFVAREPRWPGLGRVGQQLGEPRNLAFTATALLAAGRLSRDTRLRAATYDIAQAFLVNGTWTMALKHAVKRERPDGSSRLSFPSGHASNAFAWATVADHHYGHSVGLPAYAVAGLVALSRVEKNVHHLSDVVAGAALGYVVGRTVVREDGRSLGRRARLTLAPTTSAGGHGFGLALSGGF